MSALGHKRTWARLFDHLVGAGWQCRRGWSIRAPRRRLMTSSNFVDCVVRYTSDRLLSRFDLTPGRPEWVLRQSRSPVEGPDAPG
jgi:hypothetical protein